MVTNTEGDLVCGTTYTYGIPLPVTFTPQGSTGAVTSLSTSYDPTDMMIYPDLNTNAQAYFGADIDGFQGSVVRTSFVEIETITRPTTTMTETNFHSGYYNTIWTNSAGEVVNTDDRQVGVTITLDTPFVYLPASSSGTTGLPGDRCVVGTTNEGFGYPPQTLLDHMINNPAISSQFPGLASCLPAGPSLLVFSSIRTCSLVAPIVQCMLLLNNCTLPRKHEIIN